MTTVGTSLKSWSHYLQTEYIQTWKMWGFKNADTVLSRNYTFNSSKNPKRICTKTAPCHQWVPSKYFDLWFQHFRLCMPIAVYLTRLNCFLSYLIRCFLLHKCTQSFIVCNFFIFVASFSRFMILQFFDWLKVKCIERIILAFLKHKIFHVCTYLDMEPGQNVIFMQDNNTKHTAKGST